MGGTNKNIKQINKTRALVESSSLVANLPTLRNVRLKSLNSNTYMAECNTILVSLLQCWSAFELPNSKSESIDTAYKTGNRLYDESVNAAGGNINKSKLVQGGNNQTKANKCTSLMNDLIHCADGKYGMRDSQIENSGVGLPKNHNFYHRKTADASNSATQFNDKIASMYTRVTGKSPKGINVKPGRE
ncbi:hypothetical protein FOG51_00223 [Hanseniaspora uvarum]|uniref:Uncharacterized protein n=1 Tax=Hanseniaspora uvarum TaxID=29833 RepID=A0A1E5R112_HANUV|nr:hypothetical protein FOG48_02303 [Hanseniaspora uvarum]KKA01735.1 37S ribosomal protein MRP10, mitochondrial [Hanseniaspora uvarum DSM 2768]KAF0274780.1 hypothetical protein FOG51_00223 [Hanseniaspora uvarum]KAF0275362.1 hypothetical protein FOG50_03787 [Hanseniaspora uvarum]OEJ80581.1 hypothetical protein AWRI3580_g3961 [Hanseniaspora uvarum]